MRRIDGKARKDQAAMMNTTTDLAFRMGRPDDASDLAILFDNASRRICAWLWGLSAAQGQSWLEVGRGEILDRVDHKSHHLNWHVAEWQGRTVGALFGLSLADPYEMPDFKQMPPVLHPLYEMQATAKGCWLLQAVALFPEHRGQGLGPVLVERACGAARDAGHRRIVLQVENSNPGAHGLYLKCGFSEWERRPYVPFPGSDDEGDWILMVKDL